MKHEFIFSGQTTTQWVKDERYNEIFITATKNYYRDLVVVKGYVFLNDILSSLGLENTKQGQIEGWTKALQMEIVKIEGINAFTLIFNTDGEILDVFKN